MSRNTCPNCNKAYKNASARFCPSCGAKVKSASTEEKKARLTGKKSGGKTGLFVAAIVIGVAAVSAGAFFFLSGPPAQKVATQPSGEASATPNALTFPVTDFNDGQAHYYRYKSPAGKDIRFFVLKSSDSVVRAAFDSCDVCYRAKKGYRQEGDQMVCNNCGQRFASTLINEVRGGCNPAPLERTIEGDKLMVKVSDIVTGSRYF
jgi:uncharacterized membrane protein